MCKITLKIIAFKLRYSNRPWISYIPLRFRDFDILKSSAARFSFALRIPVDVSKLVSENILSPRNNWSGSESLEICFCLCSPLPLDGENIRGKVPFWLCGEKIIWFASGAHPKQLLFTVLEAVTTVFSNCGVVQSQAEAISSNKVTEGKVPFLKQKVIISLRVVFS